MSDDKPLKSAYELALERLHKQDRDAGVTRWVPTAPQKAAIAQIRNVYEAKLAELDVLHQSRLRRTADPGERATLEDRLRRDRERLSSERDEKIERIRGETGS